VNGLSGGYVYLFNSANAKTVQYSWFLIGSVIGSTVDKVV